VGGGDDHALVQRRGGPEPRRVGSPVVVLPHQRVGRVLRVELHQLTDLRGAPVAALVLDRDVQEALGIDDDRRVGVVAGPEPQRWTASRRWRRAPWPGSSRPVCSCGPRGGASEAGGSPGRSWALNLARRPAAPDVTSVGQRHTAGSLRAMSEATPTPVDVATDTRTGLTAAQVAERVADGRVNRVPDDPSRTTAQILKANVLTPVNAIVGVLLVLVVIADGIGPDMLFGLVIVANSVIGTVQEMRARAALERLAVLNTPHAT